MKWAVAKQAEPRLDAIKQALQQAGMNKLVLATDPDREGEAIAWHLSQVLAVTSHSAHRKEKKRKEKKRKEKKRKEKKRKEKKRKEKNRTEQNRKEKKRKEKKRKEKKRKEKKRLDYAFQRQFNEKPSMAPGCPHSALTEVLSLDHTSLSARPVCNSQAGCSLVMCSGEAAQHQLDHQLHKRTAEQRSFLQLTMVST